MITLKNNYDENIYYFKTDSGLETYYIHRPGFKKSTAVMGVPFGSLNLEQKLGDKIFNHPHGSAHFLEHKLFEDEKEDILSAFTKIGASANAFTSHDYTMYYFNHNGNVLEPLNLLLTFVRQFDISEDSVEKEKPIIVEEINMYDQIPDMKLINETYKNLFHAYPYIYDIAGTKESVNNTTKEDLNQAYQLNYHDERLVLVIIASTDPKEVKNLVMNHPSKSTKPLDKIEDVYPEEPLSVVYDYREIESSIETNKMSYSFKFEYLGNDKYHDRFILKRILEMNFSELNPEYQTWLDEDIISDFFTYDIILKDGFGIIVFFNQGDDHEKFKNMIDDKFNDLNTNEALFNQLTRRNYGEIILSLSQFDNLAFSLVQSHFDDDFYFDRIEKIKDLKYEDFLGYVKYFDKMEKTFLHMKKSSN